MYMTQDGGSTWTEKPNIGTRTWKSLNISNDGMKIIALADYIYISNDAGNTWIQITLFGFNTILDLCSSYDGSTIIAHSESNIYISNNGGISWSTVSANSLYSGFNINLISIALSGDGTKIYVLTRDIVSPNYVLKILFSSDNGVTWTKFDIAGFNNGVGSTIANIDFIRVSGNANRLYGITRRFFITSAGNVFTNYLYSSDNDGQSWAIQSALGLKSYSYIACSNDSDIVATARVSSSTSMNDRYLSKNYGVAWNQIATSLGSSNNAWEEAIAISQNGNTIITSAGDSLGVGDFFLYINKPCGT